MDIRAGGHRIGMDDVRPAGRAARGAFAVVGVGTATWAARIPAVQDRLGLSPGGLALVALAIEGGALCGLPLRAPAVVRAGSRRAAGAALLVYAPGIIWTAVAPGLMSLAVGLGVW